MHNELRNFLYFLLGLVVVFYAGVSFAECEDQVATEMYYNQITGTKIAFNVKSDEKGCSGLVPVKYNEDLIQNNCIKITSLIVEKIDPEIQKIKNQIHTLEWLSLLAPSHIVMK